MIKKSWTDSKQQQQTFLKRGLFSTCYWVEECHCHLLPFPGALAIELCKHFLNPKSHNKLPILTNAFYSQNRCSSFWIRPFIISITKGRIISKWFFECLRFPPRNEQKQVELRYHLVKLNSFVRFLEEVKDTKNHFEIIWPLRAIHLVSDDFAF